MKTALPVMLSTVLASALLLGGCAHQISGDVTTFHENLMPAGETIRIVPADPANAGSLEFRSYAQRISEELRDIGYTPVDDASVATDLVAEVDYEIEAGPPQIYSDNSNQIVRYHFGLGRYYNPWYFGFYNPFFYDPLLDEPQIYSTPTYNRSLEVNIVDADEDERLFEGRVESNGTESSLAEVMPYLITAMFENFPGESGKTKVVTIEKDT